MKSILLLLLSFLTTGLSTSTYYTNVPYSSHCSSIVPESHFTTGINKTIIPHLESEYVGGGDDLLVDAPPNISHLIKYVTFDLNPTIYQTVDAGLYKVDGTLTITMFYAYSSTIGDNQGVRPDNHFPEGKLMTSRRTVRFKLHGFWSEFSNKLCMVGLASQCVFAGDKPVQSNVVLKLSLPSDDNPTIHTSVVRGTLESTGSSNESGYFNPVSIFSFPQVEHYSYSLLSEEPGDAAAVPKNESLVLDQGMFCQRVGLGDTDFVLDFAAECQSGERCSPLGAHHDFLPMAVKLHPLQCSVSGERKIRYIIKFSSPTWSPLWRQSFELNTMFIAEGSWDDRNNQILVVGCQLLSQADDSSKNVGDCPLRLSLRYRSTWNLRNREKLVGRIWSNESLSTPRYFRNVELMSFDMDYRVDIPGLRYEYTELDRVRELCTARESVKENQVRYPNGHSCQLMFRMFVISFSKGRQVASGYARPISVENQVCSNDDFDPGFSSKKISSTIVNVGYEIGINYFELKKLDAQFSTLKSSPMSPNGYVMINGEGVYNSETGQLCMVGCRKLANRTIDCNIVISIEFAPLADDFTEAAKVVTRGTIRSTRRKDDPLRFEELNLIFADRYGEYDETLEDGLGEHDGLAVQENEASAAVSF